MQRHATALWKGTLKDGSGTLTSQSGAFEDQPYSFKGRFQDESGQSGTNPEELIAAAHSGCFAMALSNILAENGTPAETLEAKADVTIQPADGGGFDITTSALTLVGTVPGLDEKQFLELAEKAKNGCPVSKALGAINVTLNARLG